VSRGWGGEARGVLSGVLLIISAVVSVKAQKYGGLCDYPIGRLRGMRIKFSLFPSGGKTTANCRAADGARGTL
jgi:hypothetical protein